MEEIVEDQNLVSSGQGRGKILVADDGEPFRTYLETLLQRSGFDCEAVADGIQALDKLRESRYDVVIADVMMPGNERLELIRSLPDIDSCLEAILVTGFPNVTSAAEAIQLPVAAYLVKPFETESLLDSIELSVVRSRVRGGIVSAKERVSRWMEELNNLEKLVCLSPGGMQDAVPLESYVALTLQNIIDPVFDLKHLIEGLYGLNPDATKNTCQLFKCPRLDAQRKMLLQSVEVLEKTKRAFKSKDIGDLRKRLEQFLKIE